MRFARWFKSLAGGKKNKRGETLAFSIEIFGRAATIVMAANFHYNTTPAICQEKNTNKINKLFIPKALTNQHICAIL